ncbi:hypothetical protein [Aquisphaera insulae]|uniref:hypothetical protein n=1 Tax=Aquisphaera insulae TaxID=2712864 RepID=UPI0013EDFD8B|nr:hypothetical protein [Aquisphaera insulae]
MHEYDKSSKWLIQHYAGSILRLFGMGDVARWRALQAELVQPRRYPDGLVEAWLTGIEHPDLYILELATYPEPRIQDQAVRDACLVYLDRDVVPEVLVLVLSPRGARRAASEATLRSRRGTTSLKVRWRTVELWTIPAEPLLESGDVGLIPWIPLCRLDGPPAPIFRRCRERIDRETSGGLRENLLAVSQVLASLRYDDEGLFQLLGGREAMIDSPILRKLKAEWSEEAARKASHDVAVRMILSALVARFGPRARSIRPELTKIDDGNRLDQLHRLAVACADLEDFRGHVRGNKS